MNNKNKKMTFKLIAEGFLDKNYSLYFGIGLIVFATGIFFTGNSTSIQGQLIRNGNNVPVVAALQNSLNCLDFDVTVFDEDLGEDGVYEYDVYLDDDVDNSTRFDRYSESNTVISSSDYPDLFPEDQNMHSVIVRVKDFDHLGNPVGTTNDGWVEPYTFEWDRSTCEPSTNVEPYVYTSYIGCHEVFLDVSDGDLMRPEQYMVDVYLDSDESEATRFDRFNDRQILITPVEYPELYPMDNEVHTLKVWVKDFNNYGQAVGPVDGWIGSYDFEWDFSGCVR